MALLTGLRYGKRRFIVIRQETPVYQPRQCSGVGPYNRFIIMTASFYVQNCLHTMSFCWYSCPWQRGTGPQQINTTEPAQRPFIITQYDWN